MVRLKELERTLGAEGRWDGEGHVFVLTPEQYGAAQSTLARMMRAPKAERPRGWARGSFRDGSHFIKVLMH